MRNRLYLKLAPWIFAFACAALPLAAQAPPSTSSNSKGAAANWKQIGEAKLIVDPNCPPCDGGVLDVYLRNDTNGPLMPSITIDQNLADASGNPTESQLSLALLDPTTKQPWDASHQVQKNESLLARVTISNLRQEGDWQASIYDRGDPIAKFHVYRNHSPFSVKLDVAKPDQPELTFDRGTFQKTKFLSIPLRNEDSYSYRVRLEFVVEGIPANVAEAVLPPKSSTIAKICFADGEDWFNHWVQGRVKDETADGQLLLTLIPAQSPGPAADCTAAQEKKQGKGSNSPGSSATPAAETQCGPPATGGSPKCSPPSSGDAASKIISVTVHLKYENQPCQYAYISVVLLLGALCSLMLNAYLPNQAQRNKTKKLLQQVSARIRGLPIELASRLRVSLGLESRRCMDLLLDNWVINPQFSDVLADISPRVDRLSKRLDLSEELGRLRMRFQNRREQELFPTPMNRVKDEFERVDDLLRLWVFDQSAQSQAEQLIKSLTTHIENLEDVEKFYENQHDQVGIITTRAKRLILDGRDTSPSAGHAWPQDAIAKDGHDLYQHLFDRVWEFRLRAAPLDKGELPQPPTEAPTKPEKEELEELLASEKEPFLQGDLPDVDRLTTKMDMLRECARLSQESAKFAELAKLLTSQNIEKFDAACRLLDQIRQGVFSSEIENQITKNTHTENLSHPADPRRAEIRTGWVVMATLFLGVLVTGFGAMLVDWNCAYIFSASAGMLIVFAALGVAVAKLVNFVRRESDRPVQKNAAPVIVADDQLVRIDQGTNEVRAFEPVNLSIRFSNEALNSVAVRDDFIPFWNFDHNDLAEEEGWEVVHYFPSERIYNVHVRFQRCKGGYVGLPFEEGPTSPTPSTPGAPVPSGAAVAQPSANVAVTSPVNDVAPMESLTPAPAVAVVDAPPKIADEAAAIPPVKDPVPSTPAAIKIEDSLQVPIYALKPIVAQQQKRGARFVALSMDLVWVGVALIPAMAAMFSGGVEKLDKVDFMPYLVAVFLIGFGSDQLKNLIKKSQ